MYMVVDGRLEVGAHGPRDMPVWGSQYKARAVAAYLDVPYHPEACVRTRVLAHNVSWCAAFACWW